MSPPLQLASLVLEVIELAVDNDMKPFILFWLKSLPDGLFQPCLSQRACEKDRF
jgi:hypothetical protein